MKITIELSPKLAVGVQRYKTANQPNISMHDAVVWLVIDGLKANGFESCDACWEWLCSDEGVRFDGEVYCRKCGEDENDAI